VLNSLNTLIKSGKINDAIKNFDAAAVAVEKTANHIDNTREAFEVDMAGLSKKLDDSLMVFNKLLDQGNDQILALSHDFILTATSLRETLAGIDQAIKTTEGTFSEDSVLIDQLSRSAEEVSRAARAFRRLSDTLEQQPEALIRGRQ
jgi:paraquat-inducible protein B